MSFTIRWSQVVVVFGTGQYLHTGRPASLSYVGVSHFFGTFRTGDSLASWIAQRVAQDRGRRVVPAAIPAANRTPMSVVLDFDPPFMRSQATNEAHGAIERLAFLVVQRATRKQAATNISVSELVAVVYEVTLQQIGRASCRERV